MNPHLDYTALLPELILSVTFVLVLLTDLFVNDKQRRWLPYTSLVGCLTALAAVIWLGANAHYSSMSNGAFVVDSFSLLASGIFLTAGAIVFLLGSPSQWRGEYCQLVLASLLGMLLISSARELLIFFVAFELLAVPAYILAGWHKKTTRGTEAAIKYYLLGVLASAVMLYGISFLFGIAGSTDFATISQVVKEGGSQIPLLRIAILFVIVGVGFKVAAVPFHFWAPDAYQGAPIPVAAFLSVASKIAGFIALIELVTLAFPSADDVWAPLLFGIAIATMTVGNLLALRQTDAVRLMAYSGIAQGGYALIPLATTHGGTVSPEAIQATFEFLLIYAAANLGAFAVVIAVSRSRGSTSLDAFEGLFYRSPAMATMLTAFLLSLAGIPPLGGWFAKYTVISQAISVNSPSGMVLVVIAALNTAIALVYYLGFVRKLWLDPGTKPADTETEGNTPLPVALASVLGLTTVVVIVSGVLPEVVTQMGSWSSLIK